MGLDTETRPIWRKYQRRNPCALLQIAVRDASQKEEVFVLDLLHLSAKVYNTTLTNVFLSTTIVKLGQGLYQDLRELAQSYPDASCFTVCKGVVEVNDLSISLSGAHNPLSLQKLVFFYLHRKLAKTQQTSNWARRPLTHGQLHYAAADALVLLHLYDELLLRFQNQTAAHGFRLSDVTNVLDVNLPQSPKCSLCFDAFKTAFELKEHRRLCVVDVRTLAICKVCKDKKLVTEEVMIHHVAHCGADACANGVTVNLKRQRLQSVDSSTSLVESQQVSVSPKRRLKSAKQVQSEVIANCTEKDHLIINHTVRKGRMKKRQKWKARALTATNILSPISETSTRGHMFKKRKLSLESSLLASDTMWSQISKDCVVSTA